MRNAQCFSRDVKKAVMQVVHRTEMLLFFCDYETSRFYICMFDRCLLFKAIFALLTLHFTNYTISKNHRYICIETQLFVKSVCIYATVYILYNKEEVLWWVSLELALLQLRDFWLRIAV